MSDEEKQEIVRMDNAHLFIPVTLGIGGPQIGTGSIHRSEEGEVWFTADLPYDLFEKQISNLSVYTEDGFNFNEAAVINTDPDRPEPLPTRVRVAADWDTRRNELSERVKENNTAEFIKELEDPDRSILNRTHETGLPDGPHLFPKETP